MFAPIENVTVAVLRGTTVNQFGDIIDADTAVYTGVRAGLYETNDTVFDPASQMPRTIRETKLWLPLALGVTTDDRIVDESTGDRYMVTEVVRPPALAPVSVPLVYTIKRITASRA